MPWFRIGPSEDEQRTVKEGRSSHPGLHVRGEMVTIWLLYWRSYSRAGRGFPPGSKRRRADGELTDMSAHWCGLLRRGNAPAGRSGPGSREGVGTPAFRLGGQLLRRFLVAGTFGEDRTPEPLCLGPVSPAPQPPRPGCGGSSARRCPGRRSKTARVASRSESAAMSLPPRPVDLPCDAEPPCERAARHRRDRSTNPRRRPQPRPPDRPASGGSANQDEQLPRDRIGRGRAGQAPPEIIRRAASLAARPRSRPG